METEVKPVFQVDAFRELDIRKKRLRDTCREFESIMTSFMMKTMRDGVSWTEDHDSAKEMYEDMFAQEVSKQIGRSSVLGIGDMLYSRLEPLLETQPAPAFPGSRGDQSLNEVNDSAD